MDLAHLSSHADAACRKATPFRIMRHESRMEEHGFDANGTFINYAEGPTSGPPLVLLHGGSNRWQSWATILEPLVDRFHVFAPDLRGHGSSAWTPGRYSIRSITDDIAAFLDVVVPAPAGLFGHSLGAEVAVWVTAERPERVLALVVGDGPLSGPGAEPMVERQGEMLAFMRQHAGSDMEPSELALLMPDLPFGRDEHDRSIVARDVLGEEHPAYLDWAETMIGHDPAFLEALTDYDAFSAGYGIHLLPNIACRVLLVQAGVEGALRDEECATAKDLLRDVQLARLEGVSHGLHFAAPDLALDVVLPFLEEALPANDVDG